MTCSVTKDTGEKDMEGTRARSVDKVVKTFSDIMRRFKMFVAHMITYTNVVCNVDVLIRYDSVIYVYKHKLCESVLKLSKRYHMFYL